MELEPPVTVVSTMSRTHPKCFFPMSQPINTLKALCCAGQGDPLWEKFIPIRNNSCNHLCQNADEYLRKKDNTMPPYHSNRITTGICLDSADTYFMEGRKFYKLVVLSFFCSFLFSSSLAPPHPPPPCTGSPSLSL